MVFTMLLMVLPTFELVLFQMEVTADLIEFISVVTHGEDKAADCAPDHGNDIADRGERCGDVVGVAGLLLDAVAVLPVDGFRADEAEPV